MPHSKELAKTGKNMKTLNVVAAVICEGDRSLATQRGYGEHKDRWEFPGREDRAGGDGKGKALVREIREELKTEIVPKEAHNDGRD